MLKNLLAGIGIVEREAGAAEITVEELVGRGLDPDVQIVDVREAEEWAQGHLPGSVLMPLGGLAPRMRGLDPKRPIVTVCRSGHRSLVAAEALTAEGFRDVKSLAGGMIAWAEAGHAVER